MYLCLWLLLHSVTNHSISLAVSAHSVMTDRLCNQSGALLWRSAPIRIVCDIYQKVIASAISIRSEQTQFLVKTKLKSFCYPSLSMNSLIFHFYESFPSTSYFFNTYGNSCPLSFRFITAKSVCLNMWLDPMIKILFHPYVFFLQDSGLHCHRRETILLASV